MQVLRQHRAIVSASRSRLFAPHLQFEKREIHTVFLRFPNFELSQKSRLGLLAKLCGVALILQQPLLWWCVFYTALSISARYFFTLTSFTTQVNTFIASCKSSSAGKEGAMRMLLSWGSLP